MKKTTSVEIPVKGGCIVRNAQTGQFTEVRTGKDSKRLAGASLSSVQGASAKRRAALKRLADR